MLKELALYSVMREHKDRIYHASCVIPSNKDEIIATAFGGTHEGASDTAIYVNVISQYDGSFISENKIKVSSEAHWNPVLFRLNQHTLGLVFKVGDVIASWRSYISFSKDEGLNWDMPRELVLGDQGGRGPVRNKPIKLKSGRWLAPASCEDGYWRAFVDRSDDDFNTFEKSNEIIKRADFKLSSRLASHYQDIDVSDQSFTGKGVIQPSLWEDSQGIHMLLRSTYGCIMRSDSVDDGKTFCDAYPIPLPNNNSGIDLDVLDKTIYLVCNRVSANWGDRTPLSLYSSENGTDFIKLLDLETESKAEFSYPCVRAISNKYLWVSYTYKRQNISLRIFQVE